MSERKLVKKLAEVMKQVRYIQKTGFNDFNKYRYATEADVNEKVREVLAEQNVIMLPNMKSHSVREHKNRKGNTEYIVTAEVEFTFMDGETGETIAITVFGEGQDSGDKATYKAITGAQKYALMKAFMIPTGDDPESDTGVDERNNGNQKANDEKLVKEIKIKWQALAGSLDGFEDYYNKKIAEGVTNQQILNLLAQRLVERKKESA